MAAFPRYTANLAVLMLLTTLKVTSASYDEEIRPRFVTFDTLNIIAENFKVQVKEAIFEIFEQVIHQIKLYINVIRIAILKKLAPLRLGDIVKYFFEGYSNQYSIYDEGRAVKSELEFDNGQNFTDYDVFGSVLKHFV